MPCSHCKKKRQSFTILCKCCEKEFCPRCIDMTIHECENSKHKFHENKELLKKTLCKLTTPKIQAF